MAEVVALGLDAGSTTVKLVGVGADGSLAWSRLAPTYPHLRRQTSEMLEAAKAELEIGEVPLVATGYGRNLVDSATRKVTEITCHARGVFKRTGHGGTLVDIGGQDSKVIVIGKSGQVENFAMNDKCAAGTGRFLEVSASRLAFSLEDFSKAALDAKGEVSISSTCTVFAESEIISLVAHGEPVDRILLGLHAGLVSRILAMVRTVGLVPPLLLSGGVARNTAIVALLAEQSGQQVTMPSQPQLMGAYGAALLAAGRTQADPADGPVPQVSTGECDACDEPAPRRGLLGGFRR